MIIRCNHCKEIFDESELYLVEDDPPPSGIALPEGHYTYSYCPYCGSDEYEENFELIEKLEFEEDDETSVIASFEGRSFQLYLDENGELQCLPCESTKEVKTATKKEVA